MTDDKTYVRLAVNGTLMRGFGLHVNLVERQALFVCRTQTAPVYRLWSVNDDHPGMVRVAEGGRSVEVEVYLVPPAGLASLLLAEPPGLSIGKVRLLDGDEVLGVLAEPILVENQREITDHGSFRVYAHAAGLQPPKRGAPLVDPHPQCPDAPADLIAAAK